MSSNITITKDIENRKIHVTREFSAPVDKVWKAWTDKDILDKWWAPRPWKAETKSMDFKPGGLWLYAMAGPEGEKHWSRVDIKTVDKERGYTSLCTFCDENGNINPDFPEMHWDVTFSANGTGTTVNVNLTFDKDAGFEKIMQMGFEGGFTMALGNLDELLAAQ